MGERIKRIWEHQATGWFWCGLFTIVLAGIQCLELSM